MKKDLIQSIIDNPLHDGATAEEREERLIVLKYASKILNYQNMESICRGISFVMFFASLCGNMWLMPYTIGFVISALLFCCQRELYIQKVLKIVRR